MLFRSEDRLCGIATLTPLDQAAIKLLANSDRWGDDAVHSRDLIDLAMLQLDRALLRRALDKASGAYGASIGRDLAKAIEAMKRRKGRLEQCMAALRFGDVPPGVAAVPPALIWKAIKRLLPR